MSDAGCRKSGPFLHASSCIRHPASFIQGALFSTLLELRGVWRTMPSFRFDSQVALVTSASAGMGAAIAVACAEAGADVAVHETTRAPDETCARVRQAGRRAVPITGDLADASEPARLVADVLGAFGRLDILVCLPCSPAALDAARLDAAWDRLIAARLSSTFRLCRAFGTYLLETGRTGRIVNVALPRDRHENPACAACNGGITQMTRALAREWASRGIAANVIVPGYLRAGEADARANPPADTPDGIPGHGWGRPEDVAGAAVFLASPAAAFVNGHVLVVDGAWPAR
jgi:2-dehydro-3-deoxy-D-gluconate 5-dehydrogenase